MAGRFQHTPPEKFKKKIMNFKTIKIFAIIIFIKEVKPEHEFATIKKAEPTITFQPLGKLVTQFAYANIKININITKLYDEVNSLCLAAKILEEEMKSIGVYGLKLSFYDFPHREGMECRYAWRLIVRDASPDNRRYHSGAC